MRPSDQLQLIDPETIRHVAGLESDGLWQLTLTRLDELKRLEGFHSPALHGLPRGMEHFEKCFWMFYDEDPDHVRWGLIHDLGFLGKPVRIDPWAASGYLDDASSAGVQTSRDLIPEFDDESEANVYGCLFDVLEADHLDLIADSVRRFENLGSIAEKRTGSESPGFSTLNSQLSTRLKIDTMAKAIRKDPSLRAAYIYHQRGR